MDDAVTPQRRSDSHVRVVARIRPLNEMEAKRGCRVCLQPVFTTDENEAVDKPPSLFSRLKSSFSSPPTSTSPMMTIPQNSAAERLDEGIVLNDSSTFVGNVSVRSLHQESSISPTPVIRKRYFASEILVESSIKRRFALDAVLAPTATQADVYEHCVGNAIAENLMKGYNTTILAYGQTGSGKTYTMGGARETKALGFGVVQPQLARHKRSDDGITARSIQDVFDAHDEYSKTHKVRIQLSCLEIYQDELRDLLVEDISTPLALRDNGTAVQIPNLTMVQVQSAQQVELLLDEATQRRTTASTRLNERSSRSHAIATLTVTITPLKQQRQIKHAVKVTAKLTLVDLAGSERIKETGVVGVQQQESININKDLFVLGKVVSALSERAKKGTTHVPYRDSKLTRLLRDSLGGNCSTVLIACVSPADLHLDESINTLRYAERSRTITNTLRQNVIQSTTPAEAASLRAENTRLKTLVAQLQQRLGMESDSSSSSTQFEGLSGLQAKLKQAEEEAKAARENSRFVAQSADRWREHFEAARTKSSQLSSVSPCLSYELSLGDDDEDSLIDDDDDDDDVSIVSLDGPVDNELLENVARLRAEVKALQKEKETFKVTLEELSNQIESKRGELEALDETFVKRQSDFRCEMEREHVIHEALAYEITQMKRQSQLVAAKQIDDHVIWIDAVETTSIDDNDEAKTRQLRKSSSGVGKADATECQALELAIELGKSVGEERTRCEDLKRRCLNVRQDLRTVNGDNDCLRRRCDELEDDLSRLQTQTNNMTGALEQNDSSHDNTRCKVTEFENTGASLDVDGLVVEEDNSADRPRSATMASSPTPVPDEMHGPREVLAPKLITFGSPVGSWGGQSMSVGATEERDDSSNDNERSAPEPLRGITETTYADQERTPEPQVIRARAEEILRMADRAMTHVGASSNSVCSSVASSLGTDFVPWGGYIESGCEPATCVISNIETAGKCMCESSLFDHKEEHVEFYLPQLGVSCTCGKRPALSPGNDTPCALESILRPWQVEFLSSIGLTGAVEFVHAFKQRGAVIAKQMRRWRKERELPSIRTKSCLIALHIWHRTCKSVVRHVREQEARGVQYPSRPGFLEISLAPDGSSVSTIGVGSTTAL